jgi:hypothetical protein
MPRRLKAILVNLIVAGLSVAITYLVIQFIFFRFFLTDVPPNLRPYLSDRARIFAQTSTVHESPHDYVALLGDSYAEGVGDWMLTAGGEKKNPFSSADVIHAQTGAISRRSAAPVRAAPTPSCCASRASCAAAAAMHSRWSKSRSSSWSTSTKATTSTTTIR